jgi:Gas vesicle synthesis protein GvpL/GvpF
VSSGEPTVYVYGVLAESDRGAVSEAGVAGSSVRTIACAGVAALVSDLSTGTIAAAKEVRAHWRVLDEAAKAATVLPVRFGTVMTEPAVRDDLLAPNADGLSGLLDRLAGQVQLSIKGEYDQDALLRDIVGRSRAIAALRERVRALPDAAGYYERIRLGELVAAAVAAQRDHDQALALDRLQDHAVQSRAEEPRGADGAFDLAFLVRREQVDGFSQAVGALRADLGERIRLRYVGPLPPYSFAALEE